MAGVGPLKRIWKDVFRVAGAILKTFSSEMLGGQGNDFRKRFAFWSIGFSSFNFAGRMQHFVKPGITVSWQAQYFGQMEWKNWKTYWHEAVSSARNLPFLKDVSQRFYAFEAANF